MEGLKKILEDMKKEELNLDNLEMKKIYKLCCKRGYEGSEERFSKDFINILMEGLKNLKISNEDLLKVAGGSNIMNSKKFTAAALSILGLTSSFSPTAGASFLTENKNISEISRKGMAWVKQNPTKVGVGTALTTGGAIGLAAILGVGAHALKKVDLEDLSAIYLSKKINEIGKKFEAKKDNFKIMDEGEFKNFASEILGLKTVFEEPAAAGDNADGIAVIKAKTEKEAYNAFMRLGGKDLKSKLEKIVNASDDNSGDDDQSKKDEELKNNKVVVLRAWINLLDKALSISKKENSGGFIILSTEVAEATLPALMALDGVLPLDENSPESKLKDIMSDFGSMCKDIQEFYKLIYEVCSENEATIKNANGFGLYDLRKKLFACKNTSDINALKNEIGTKKKEFKDSPQAKLFNELETAQKGKETAEKDRDAALTAQANAEKDLEKKLEHYQLNRAYQHVDIIVKVLESLSWESKDFDTDKISELDGAMETIKQEILSIMVNGEEAAVKAAVKAVKFAAERIDEDDLYNLKTYANHKLDKEESSMSSRVYDIVDVAEVILNNYILKEKNKLEINDGYSKKSLGRLNEILNGNLYFDEVIRSIVDEVSKLRVHDDS